MTFNTLTDGSYQLSLEIQNFISFSYFPLLFSYLPFVWLYLLVATGLQKRISPIHTLHFIPSVVLILISTVNLFFDENILIGYQNLLVSIYYSVALLYLMKMAIVVKAYFKRLGKKPTDLQQLHKRWVVTLVASLSVVMLVFLTSFLISFYEVWARGSLVSYLLSLGLFSLFLFANGVLLFMLKEPKVINSVNSKEKRKDTAKLPNAVNQNTADKLIKVMDDELLFLDPLLTLNKVADKMGLHPKTTSMLLKHVLKKNFNDFVNSYRVETAQQKIEKYGSQKTLAEVQLESGFNSKSVFNSAFKNQTGMTPSQFRKDKMLEIVSVET